VAGGKVRDISVTVLNSKNRNVAVTARLEGQEDSLSALYLWQDGRLKPVAIPGQEMPGGGQLQGAPDTLVLLTLAAP